MAMGITIVLATLLLLAVLALVPHIVRRVHFVRLVNKIPGPPSYPLLGSVLPFLLAPKSKQSSVLLQRVRQYQPIMRNWVGPIALIYLTRPEHIEVIMNSNKYLHKSYVHKLMEPWLGTGLVTSNGEKWQAHRKMLTPTFHHKILNSFVEVFSQNSEILIRKLQQEVGSQGFDVYPYITLCALDILCETAMGTPVHVQEGANSTYVSAVHDMIQLVLRRTFRPWLQYDPLYRLTKDGKRHAECLNTLHSFTNKVIQERKTTWSQDKRKSNTEQESDDIGLKRRVAFLDMLLEASEGYKNLTDEEIREEVDTFMVAGHDTTSAAICWVLFLLGLHPFVQEKVYAELEGIFKDSNRSPTFKELNEMRYLERVIKESLRLYPSVPVISRLLEEDIEIGGYKIPAGCTIAVHVYMNHRNPDQFPNPEMFDPDNFLPERVEKRHPSAYIPFSAGPRNCIGQKFAMLEMKTVVSCLLRSYKLRSLDRKEDINIIMGVVMRPEKGIRLTITPRTKENTKM